VGLVGLLILFLVLRTTKKRGPDIASDSTQVVEPGPMGQPGQQPAGPAQPGPAAWQYVADAEPAAKAMPAGGPIRLPVPAANVHDVVFTRPDVSHALVVYFPEEQGAGNNRPVRVDRFHLGTGRQVGSIDLGQTNFRQREAVLKQPVGAEYLKAAVSPDGSRLLLHVRQTPNTLALWDLAGKRRLASWQPHGGDEVAWFEFLDNVGGRGDAETLTSIKDQLARGASPIPAN
jgi:hypothetical protein